MQETRPPIKWVGGKSQILGTLLEQFPREIRNYHEPFLGGGSVLLGVLQQIRTGAIRISGKIYAYDANPHLIQLYRDIQNPVTCDELIRHLDRLVQEHAAASSPETHYYEIRTQYNEMVAAAAMVAEAAMEAAAETAAEAMAELDPEFAEEQMFELTAEIAAAVEEEMAAEAPLALVSAYFLFLNKTCFRGLYRVGPRGFNVPYGHYAAPVVFTREHLYAVRDAIRDVRFICSDFRNTLPLVNPGDFVYMDPPYFPVNPTSFTKYTGDGFTLDMHESLVSLSYTLTEQNTEWLMSNADVPWIRTHFPEPSVEFTSLTCRRAICAKKPNATAPEVLIHSRCQG